MAMTEVKVAKFYNKYVKESHDRYRRRNRDTLNRKKRQKYNNDGEYRSRVKASNKRWAQKRKAYFKTHPQEHQAYIMRRREICRRSKRKAAALRRLKAGHQPK